MTVNLYNMHANSNTCYTCGDDLGNMYVEPIINCDLNSPNTCYTCGDDLGNMYVEPKTTKTYTKPETNNTYIKSEIVSFYENNTIDPSFDFVLYAGLYPETDNFWKYFCKTHNIDDKHRLYFHYKKHYSDAAKNDTSEMYKCTSFVKDHTVLHSKDIEQILPVDKMFVESYNERTELGKEIAKDSKIAIVALARDCGDISLQDSINRVKSLCTNQTSLFVYENDSKDGTKDILKNNNIECISHNLNLESLQDRSYTRTERLANYRNVCLGWVRDNHSDADYVIVLDLDADLGFSIDGIYNSIYWLNSIENAGGMGSYSLYLNNNNYMHYDSFAIRMNDWKPSYQSDHNNIWVKNWHPLVGSKPVQMYSCFGGLGVYKTDAFLNSKYKGELGSEHVDFHKTMQENGWSMYLNPSSRFFSVYKNK
jgi:DNA-directed RNA polymerase subunit N (RpoN/RPB10)